MFIFAAILYVSAVPNDIKPAPVFSSELSYAKKKKSKSSSGAGRKFSSCKAARKAGYSHMRRGSPGYSRNLDRDGDGVACDKVK